jgi:putative addiction module component (TIGR02574 family)
MSHSILDFDFHQLTVTDRYELMRRVWESLQAEGQPPDDGLQRLLEERFRRMEEHPDETLSWEEFHAQVFPDASR